MKAAADKVVTIAYTLKNDAGEVVDSSEGGEPLTYIHGRGEIVPGLEKAIEGKGVGDDADVVIPPAEGYGVRDEKAVRNFPLRKLALPKEAKGRIGPGSRVGVPMADGMRVGTVLSIKGDYASVDTNHPLADKTLHFSVKVTGIRDLTDEEKAHGHVHGPGGHHG